MGLPIEREDFDEAEYRRFAQRLRESLCALQELLERPGFGEGAPSLGAEVEFSIIDRACRPLPMNRAVLAQSLDPRLQLELDRFNLEYNLSPVPASGRPFSALQAEMTEALEAVDAIAAVHGGRVVPIGILPTLQADDLGSLAMTDLPRYRALSAGLRRLRQGPFEVCIYGDEPLELTADDVTLEGANTSLQVHLRVSPRDFAATYNAVQLATPIALSAGANSPFFLGRRLWDETRVALFKQAVDDRDLRSADWRAPARVSFGHGWVRHGAHELFAEAVALFPPLLPVTGDEHPLECARDGGLPGLDELRLHQGTVWRWNRAIYDPSAGGHLRIEMRSLPAGPSPVDMIASAAFLIGLALGLRSRIESLLPGFPFEYAQRNFYRAAQHALDAQLLWPEHSAPSPRALEARELVRQLLPVAEEGLDSCGVDSSESRTVLGVIQARLESGIIPARWQKQVVDRIRGTVDRTEALTRMLELYVRESKSGRPVYEWSREA
jgi:gamma-glutamyl:cysteine ligase YbdK (ATP-grasp superfamily)